MDNSINGTENSISEIQEFFQNKSVFITGATGFLGKALVEKLLRSCYDINKIYLLVRPKKGKTTSERMNILTDSKLFEKIKEKRPEFKEKLVVIDGDLLEPDLGISEEDKKILIQNVNIVYHSAASVRFNDPIKKAVDMNIIGVKKVITLCKQIKNLKSFIHISTAYSNCDLDYISEKVYSSPVKADELIRTCEWMDEDIIDSITPKLLKTKPNTYVFTKQIAESLILEECKDLPVSIIRPSIVGATWREPLPGWIDNFNGPTALFPAIGKGVIRTMLGNLDGICDMIPVDVTVNLMISVAWFTAEKNDLKKINVFNNTSGQINKFTWGDFQSYGMATFDEFPFENPFFIPDGSFTTNKLTFHFRTLFEQHLPAYIMDFIFGLIGKKKILVDIQKKISKATGVLQHFTLNQWEFTNNNIHMLTNKLNDKDRQLFNFDITELNWENYIKNYCVGTKIHLMKEDMSRIPQCRKRIVNMKRFRALAYTSLLILFIGIVWKSIF